MIDAWTDNTNITMIVRQFNPFVNGNLECKMMINNFLLEQIIRMNLSDEQMWKEKK